MSPTATKTHPKSRSNGSATITASQAKQLLRADDEVRKRRAQLEEAERDREEVRKRLRPRVPLSSKKEEKAKRVRAVTIAGISIRISPAESGSRFSLSRYREAGHQVTEEMKDAITPGKPYDRWTVKAPAG